MNTTTLSALPTATLRVMRATLASRRKDSAHEHDQSDQLAAIDAELERRSPPAEVLKIRHHADELPVQDFELDTQLLVGRPATLPREGSQRDSVFAQLLWSVL